MSAAHSFNGFADPQANYFRLPNDWFDTLALLRQTTDERIVSEIKLLEYVLRHTWGYRHFDGQISLSADEICLGRKHRGQRLDQGTGLSENSTRKATKRLGRFGALEILQAEARGRRVRAYRPRLSSSEITPVVGDVDFAGFDQPETNYFKVPYNWTDLCRPLQSAAAILTVEYFFRHAWGFHNPNGVWLEMDEIANGRRYANGNHYDHGIGYDVKTLYRALPDVVARKHLVWAEKGEAGTVHRVYNLRLKGMAVDDTPGENMGRYLGPLPWDRPDLDEAIRKVEDISHNLEGETSVNKEDAPTQPSRKVEAVSREVEDVSRNSEDVIRDPEDVVRNYEAIRGEPNTHTLNNTLKPTLLYTPTTDTATARNLEAPPLHVAVVGALEEFLVEVGIENPAKRQILKVGPESDITLAWSLYAWAQPNLDRNKPGFLIQRLLSSHDASHPPDRFLAFAQLSLADWDSLLEFLRPYSFKQVTELPPHLQSIAPLWLHVYEPVKTRLREQLPPGVMEAIDRWRETHTEASAFESEDE